MTKEKFIESHSLLPFKGIQQTLKLLADGATIPFIARYRKEKTGGLDEVQIATIRDASNSYVELIKRQESILSSIEDQGKLNEELKSKISSCFDKVELEDLYLPFKQKRKTKAEVARSQGLESLAKMIMAQRGGIPDVMAKSYLKNGVDTIEEAIQGAQHIISEWISENNIVRSRIREMFQEHARLEVKVVKGKDDSGDLYRAFFDHNEKLASCPSHRFLAINRGQTEGVLNIKARPNEEFIFNFLKRFFVKSEDELGDLVYDAALDAYRRLIRPSIENEILSVAKAKADEAAIKVFAKNLRQLLLAAPLGSKRILAIDPGFRTGCKVVCLDEQGALLTNVTIYPHPPQNEKSKAQSKIAQLVQAYKIDAIAIGDGTAGRETENLIRHTRFDRDIEVYVVREDGASIYSASSIARKEFPQYDVTVRGAVSIGRRLMDPLAELIKIDPKSIGVGQYQHDVNQTQLKQALDDVVISCVNQVGVDLNTASPYILAYISGLGSTIAENIINYRQENGRFNSREDLKKVPRLGDKAFEQAAGFIRIAEGKNPLDNTSVHPENYALVQQLAKGLNTEVKDLIGNQELLKNVKESQLEVDHFTYEDIINELKKPIRDPRKKAKILEFDHRIKTINDLKPGMEITGLISNVTNFGAFVNIGIKENGLIHKSNMSDNYVEDPSTIVSLHQHVKVEVVDVDVNRKRIGLKLL